MPNFIELIESGDNIGLKKYIDSKLFESAGKHLEDRKHKVIAEMFSREAPELTESKQAEVQVVSPVQDLIHCAQKYGFEPYDSTNTLYGKVHTLVHPTGQQLRVHQTRNKCFWAHHALDEGDYVNHGHGDSAKDLRKHLAEKFPAPQVTREMQVESIKQKYGVNLVESLKGC